MGKKKNVSKEVDHKEARVKNANLTSTVTGMDPEKTQKKPL